MRQIFECAAEFVNVKDEAPIYPARLRHAAIHDHLTELADRNADSASGFRLGKRPGLDKLMMAVARRDVDMVAAWSVDRLGRSLTDLLDVLKELHAKGVDLYLHQQGLDTSTPSGRAMFQMMGVFAEFERAMIRERVIAGLAHAREEGTRLGRRPIGAAKITAIRERLAAGQGMRRIARELRCGVGTVTRIRDDKERRSA